VGRRITIAVVAGVLVAVLGALVTPLLASDPASSTLAVPAAIGGTATSTWKGTVAASQPSPLNECNQFSNSDSHALTITVPTAFYDSRTAEFTFSITWVPNNPTAEAAGNDLIITVVDSTGTVVANNDGSETTETAVAANLPAGQYTVRACGYINLTDQTYTGSVTVKTAAVGGSGANANPNTANDNQLRFSDATVVDPILFGGEPGINFDPGTADGSRSYVDWPVSSRTNIGVLFRSDDGGVSYRKRYADPTDPANNGVACLGRQVPTCIGGGGGDTDVNVNPGNGNLYFSSQESLVAQLVGTSFNQGVTFPTANTNPLVSAPCTGVDRQWLASWKDTQDVWLAFHIPIVGECLAHSTNGGATWLPVLPIPINNVTQSGAMVADNTGGATNHNLYIVYNTSLLNGVSGVGQYGIGVSQDGGVVWKTHVIPDSGNLRNFNKLQIDTAGNLYATWVDSQKQHTWLSTSLAGDPANVADPASKWSAPVIVEGGPLKVTIFPDIVAGSPGKVAVAYYGTTAAGPTPDDVKPGQGGWHPYVATSANALCQWDANPCASPKFHQSQIAHQANHDDNICTSGTTCVVLPEPSHPGNRNLLDYFDISLDGNGYLGFVWSDTRNATGLPFVKVATQQTGPSLLDGKPAAAKPKRAGSIDPAGDALWPIAGAKLTSATNRVGADLRGVAVGLVKPDTIQIRLAVNDATKLAEVPAVSANDDTVVQQAKYVTRWDFNGKSYYAAANVPAGGAPTFFSGEVSTAEALLAPSSTAPFGNTYKALGGATGKVDGNDLLIDVPVSAVGNPTLGSSFFSVASYAMYGPRDELALLTTAPVTVDSTPTYDVALAGPAADAILRGGGGVAGIDSDGAGRGALPATGGLGAGWVLAGLGAGVAAFVLSAGKRRVTH
jgi:hypothetical protein